MSTRVNRRAILIGAAAAIALGRPALALPARIAVLVRPSQGANIGDIDRFIAQLNGGILATNRYTLVDRNRLGAVLQEQGFSNSAYADPATAAKLGKIVGASHVLSASLEVDVEENRGAFVTTVSFDASSDYELIEVSTARIGAGGSADGSAEAKAPSGGSPTALSKTRRAAIDACAEDLLGKAFAG